MKPSTNLCYISLLRSLPLKIGLEDGYFGLQDPISITETTKRVLIKFVADGSRNAPGFNATYNIVITQGNLTILL